MGKQQNSSIKPLDYFADIKSVVVPDQFRQVLSQSGRDPDVWQAELNTRIKQGGETKFDAINRAFSAFDQVGQTNKYTSLLQQAAKDKETRRAETESRRAGREERSLNTASTSEVPEIDVKEAVKETITPNPTERVSASTAFFGSLYNSLAGLVEGTVNSLSDADNFVQLSKGNPVPMIIENAQNKKAIKDNFNKIKVDLDEQTKKSPFNFSTNKVGNLEVDFSEADDPKRWLASLGSGVGSLVSILAPNKKASFLMSFMQQYTGNQDDALEAGLVGPQAVLYTTGTSLVQSALELVGDQGILKALKGDAGKEVIKQVVKDKAGRAITDLAEKGITKDIFNDVVERTFKESVSDLANKNLVDSYKKIAGNLWGKFKKGAAPEAVTEFLQEWTTYGAQRGYNALMADEKTTPGQGEFQTDAFKTLGDASFGALLGGFLGGSIGSFAPNSKELHETLGAFVSSDIKTQLAANPNLSLEDLKGNARVKGLLDVATQNGQFNDANGQLDQAKLEQVAKKADLLYDTFYEFKDLPNLSGEDRLSMFNITDTRNRLQETQTQFAAGVQQVNEIEAQVQQARAEGNLLAATKLEATRATVEQQLGEKNPETGEYLAAEELTQQAQKTESIFNQAIPEITNADPGRKALGRSFLNSNLFPDDNFTPDSETILSDGSLVVRDDNSTAIRLVNTVPVQPESDITSQLDKGTYKPITRFTKEYVPINNYQAYAEAANNIASDNTQRATDAAKSPYDYRQDATDLIGVASQAAATLSANPSVYDAVSDRVTKAYEFYTQIAEKDAKSTTPSVPALTEEEFQNAVGFLPAVNGVRVDPFEQTILAKQAELNIPADVASLYTPSNDAIDTILDIEEGNTNVPIKTVEKSIKELTSLRKLWQNKRKSSRREYTLPQIDEVVGAIENDLNTLANEISYQQAPELRPERIAAPEPATPAEPVAPTEAEIEQAQTQEPVAEDPVQENTTEPQAQQPITEPANENPVSEGTRRNTRKPRSVKQQYVAEAELARALESTQDSAEPVRPEPGLPEQSTEETIPSEETEQSLADLAGQLDSLSEEIGSADGQIQEVNRRLNDVLDETAGDVSGSEPDTQTEAAPVRERVSNPTTVQNVLTQITKAFPNVDVVVPANLQEFMQEAGLPIDANAPTGFIRSGQVFLNPQTIQNDPNTPIHEFGHIWSLWAKTNNPELYNKGMSLIQNSSYLRNIKRDRNYKGLSEEAQIDEALAKAIGDKGAQFVGANRKADFKKWLNQVFKNIQSYYNSIKSIAGLTPEQMADLAVDEFAANVAEDLLSGNEISGIDSAAVNAIMNPVSETAIETTTEPAPVEEASAPQEDTVVESEKAMAWDMPVLFTSKVVSPEVGRNVSFDQAGTPTRGVIEGEDGEFYKVRGTRSGKLYTVPKSEVSDAVLFSFGMSGSGEQLGTQQELKNDATADLRSAGVYGVLDKKLTTAQKNLIDKTAKKFGWKYLGAQEVGGVKVDDRWERDISKDMDSFFLADGKMAFIPLKGKEGAPGRVAEGVKQTETWLEKLRSTANPAYKTALWLVDSSFDRLNNIETFVKAMDGQERLYKQLISDVKRMGSQNRNYAFNILGRQYEDFRRQLGKYAVHKGSSTLESVEKVPVELVQWDRNLGKSVKRNVSLPASVVMNIVASHQSQRAMGEAYTKKKAKDSMGVEYDEDHTSLVIDSYYDTNPDDINLFWKDKGGVADVHKGVHFKRDVMLEANAKGELEVVQDGRQYGLFTQSEMDRMEDYVMNSGPADLREGYQKVKAAFNDAQVRELIRKENDEAINPADPFVLVPDYSPLQSVNSVSAQDKVNSFSPNLEDAKQLNERTSRPEAIYAEDILDSFDYYKESVGHILGSTRLVHNLKNLQQAISTDYEGPLKGRIDGILSDTIKNLQSYRQSQFETSRKEKALRPLLLLMGKYTGNIFRSNLGISTKQIGTWFSAMGLGYIDNKYMFGNLEIWGAMAKMSFGGSLWDRFAGGSIVEATGKGLKVGSIDTQEADYIRDLLGDNITDATAKEEHKRNWATVIQRVVYGQSQYTESADLGQLRFTRAGLAKTKQLWNYSDAMFEEYGMANIRRLDRAVILGYMVAAKRQVADEVAAGKVKPEDADARAAELTTETLYLTNQMSDPSDLTMLQRNPTFANRIIGMYSGQTQKLWNQMAGAAIDYFKYADTATPEEKALLQNRLIGSLASNLLVNTMWMATANLGASVLRGWLSGADDKEDGYYQDKFKWDVARYMTGIAPGWWSQVASFVISDIDNEKWKDEIFDVPGSDAVSQAWELTKATYGLTASVFVDKTEKEKTKLLNDFTYNFSKIFGVLSGVPKTWIDPVAKRLKETTKAPKGIKEDDIQIDGETAVDPTILEPSGEEEAPEYLYDN